MSQFNKDVLDYLQNSKMMRKSFESNYGIDLTVTPERAKFTYRMIVNKRKAGAIVSSTAHDFILDIKPAGDLYIRVTIFDWFTGNTVYQNKLYCPDKQHIRQIVNTGEYICKLRCIAVHQMGMLNEMA